MENPSPVICLIWSVRLEANNWCVVDSSCRSGDSPRPWLETRVGCAGEVLEADLPKPERRDTVVRNTPSSTSTIESRPARAQEGFSRCRTSGEAIGSWRADPKLRTQY